MLPVTPPTPACVCWLPTSACFLPDCLLWSLKLLAYLSPTLSSPQIMADESGVYMPRMVTWVDRSEACVPPVCPSWIKPVAHSDPQLESCDD